jgi:hypothetical protein
MYFEVSRISQPCPARLKIPAPHSILALELQQVTCASLETGVD